MTAGLGAQMVKNLPDATCHLHGLSKLGPPRVWAMVNWARLITCKIADLTREVQTYASAQLCDHTLTW